MKNTPTNIVRFKQKIACPEEGNAGKRVYATLITVYDLNKQQAIGYSYVIPEGKITRIITSYIKDESDTFNSEGD